MGIFQDGPGYTVKDLVSYAGFFGGVIGAYKGTESWDIHPLIRLVGAMLVGGGAAWVLEILYARVSRPHRDPDLPPPPPDAGPSAPPDSQEPPFLTDEAPDSSPPEPSPGPQAPEKKTTDRNRFFPTG